MKILIYGIGGKMGRMVLKAAFNEKQTVVAGVDKFADPASFDVPIYKNISEVKESFDVIIDFSVRISLDDILPYATKNKIPCVLCTTGYNAEEYEKIEKASKEIAIFQCGNMSLGINVLEKLTKLATAVLKDKADIEIIETHHNQKIDAPSGTAFMLLDAIFSEKSEAKPVFGRDINSGKREKNDVALHAIRGGTIVGKHEVMFILDNEVITIKHEAENKMIFAQGAVNAGAFLIGKRKGLYNMQSML